MPGIVGDPLNPVINSSTFGYLTSAQALADYATLITDFKKNLSAENSPVIVFGASYAGSKRFHLKLKNPIKSTIDCHFNYIKPCDCSVGCMASFEVPTHYNRRTGIFSANSLAPRRQS